MLTEKEFARLKRVEKRFLKTPPTKAELYIFAKQYKAAVAKYLRAYDGVDKVRGLDEFDPKHVAWENRVWHAENAKDLAKELLTLAARYLP